MRMWEPYALEVGIGHIQVADRDDNESGIKLGGGLNGKYLFYSGLFRPYLQLGFGMSTGVSGDGAGVGDSGFYCGGGLMIIDSSFYIYSAYNLSEGHSGGFLQFGVGFHL